MTNIDYLSGDLYATRGMMRLDVTDSTHAANTTHQLRDTRLPRNGNMTLLFAEDAPAANAGA